MIHPIISSPNSRICQDLRLSIASRSFTEAGVTLAISIVWDLFKKNLWRGTATDGFGDLGYHCHVRQEQAARYLPQYRHRGISIVTRDDYYNKAMGKGISDLFTAEVGGTNPTIESSRLVGPEPPIGHPAHLTVAQIRLYSPDKYHELSWPWKGYNRIPRDQHRLPTVMHAHGTSEQMT